MKTLLLMRNAKSSWKDQKLVDINRPLNKHGQHMASMVGKLLIEKELVPQLIISSSAVRARQTAELVAAGAGYTGEIQYLSSLYMAEPSAYLGVLSATSDEYERVLVVGHNPGLEALLQILSRRIIALRSASVAFVSLPLRFWRDLNGDVEGELIEFIAVVEEKQVVTKEKATGKMKSKGNEKKAEMEEKKSEKKSKS